MISDLIYKLKVTHCTYVSGYDVKIISYLVGIKHQNQEIIHQNQEIIRLLKRPNEDATSAISEEDFPFKLPLTTIPEILQAEKELQEDEKLKKLVSYMYMHSFTATKHAPSPW